MLDVFKLILSNIETFSLSLHIYIILMVLDYIVGVFSAIYHKKLSSKIGYKGIIKKFSAILVVFTVMTLDIGLNLNGTMYYVILTFFYCNEGISILENSAELGVPIPKRILMVLNQIRAKNDDIEVEEEEKKED